MRTTISRTKRATSDPLRAMGSGLAEKLKTWGISAESTLLVNALHELLDGQDDETKQLRMAIQIHLARASNASTGSEESLVGVEEYLLSTEDAAQLMGCSRPYVAMLIDAGKLAGGVKSKGGHRKVPKSSVLQWIENAKVTKDGDADYRKAALETGMYAVTDEVYVKAAVKRSCHSDD